MNMDIKLLMLKRVNNTTCQHCRLKKYQVRHPSMVNLKISSHISPLRRLILRILIQLLNKFPLIRKCKRKITYKNSKKNTRKSKKRFKLNCQTSVKILKLCKIKLNTNYQELLMRNKRKIIQY